MLDHFREHGRFVLNGDFVRLELAVPLPAGWGIYAFRQGKEWMYVGSAQRTARRLRGYLRHQSKASQSRAVHVALRRALAAGPVAVFALPFDEPVVEFEGMPIHVPLGAEAGLIHRLNPPWNRRGRSAAVVAGADSR